MADGDIGSVIDTLEYDTAFSNFAQILKHSSSIAVIFYGNSSSNQQLVTVEVNSAGQITDTVKDTLAFNGFWAGFLSMAWRSTGTLVMAGRMALSGGDIAPYVASVSVGDAGQLPGAITQTLKIHPLENSSTSIIHLYGDIMVVAHDDANHDGFITTFSCSVGGGISGSVIDSYEFESVDANELKICKVSDTVVAVVYKDPVGDGWLKTFEIDSAGNITASAIDSFEFEPGVAYRPNILHLLGDIFVIAWADADVDGQIITIDIDSSGNIGAAAIDSWEYNTVRAAKPQLCKVSDGIIAITYGDIDGDGRVTTIAIDAAGAITKTAIDELEYEPAFNDYPDICHMTGNIYLLENVVANDDGFVRSVDIQTPSVGRPKQLMTMGIG